MFLLSRLVRSEGYKVVLSGEGADEILGGYNIFKEAKIRQYWARQPGSTRRPLLLERLYPYVFANPARGRSYLQDFFNVKRLAPEHPFFSHEVRWENGRKNCGFFSEACQAELQGYDPLEQLAHLLPADFSQRDLMWRAQSLEMKLFLSGFLLSSQGDRVGMAHSVEMRHPFLDYRVIDFAFRLPGNWKLRGLKEKYLLKRAFRGRVPESITRRNKQPYRAPINELFSMPCTGDYVDELLSESSIKDAGYFHPAKVTRLYGRFRNAKETTPGEFQNMALIGVLSTQILHQQFIKGERLRSIARLEPDRIVTGSHCGRSEGR
jgi:asparagine synthase (glutamine-hydrolysing)